ncbi:MAG TPA: hypothetical protein VFF70_13990 [Anaerolineae bacterium]|nr:hypothetical protein [Anaerolineae bacterium]
MAYLKGVRQYNQGKTDRNLDIVAKYTQQDREVVKDACWQAINADGQIDLNSIVDFGNWAVKNNLLDVAVPPAQFWDPSFIDYANGILQATP